MKLKKQLIALFLAAVMIAAPVSGCKKRDTSESGSSSSTSATTSSSSGASSSSKADPSKGTIADITPNFLEVVAGKKKLNSDTVGWLQVAPTSIDDVVVMHKSDIDYYLRRNFNKENSFNGIYFADTTAEFGDGTRAQLGTATTIYGHAMTDNSKSDKYKIMFGPLHDIRDPEQAKQMPYLYFSTDKENMVFEVFAAFIANSDNTKNPYNQNNKKPGEYYKMVKEQILPRSLYNYDVELKEDDKFLTLSTCIYKLPDGTPTNYPNTYYRFAIMGRLVAADAPLKHEAVFTINDKVLIDKDGKVQK